MANIVDKEMYSERNIRKILERAGQIQAISTDSKDGNGLTFEELLSVAEEVGISKEVLIQAIQEVENPIQEQTYNWIEGTSKLQHHATLPVEISDEDWNEIVMEIRRTTGGIGRISKNKNVYEWEQRRQELGYTHLSFTGKKDKTEIQFVTDWAQRKMMVSSSMAFLSFLLTVISLKPMLPKSILILTGIAAALLSLPISRLFFKGYFEKQKQKMHLLFANIAKKIGKPAANNTQGQIGLYDEMESDASFKSGSSNKQQLNH